MVRHIVDGIVEAVGVIIERAGTGGRTRVFGGGDKEVVILRHFRSQVLGMCYNRRSAVEVPVFAINQRKRGFVTIEQPCCYTRCL